MSVVLLCEGKHDRAVLAQLIESRGLGSARSKLLIELKEMNPDYFLVRPVNENDGGFTWIVETLETVLNDLEIKRVAIVVDGDDKPDTKRAAISALSKTFGFQTPPPLPWPAGCVVQSSSNRLLGIWIMPDNQSAGKLETLLGRAIDSTDPNWNYANKVLDDVKKPCFESIDREKAQLRTWLAWQDPPGLEFGTAITGNKFKQHAVFDSLAAWLANVK